VKQYIKFNRAVVVLAALVVMALGVMAVSAQEDTDTSYLPTIADGRVNLYDIAAPVAIYDVYAYPYADNVNAGVLDRIEFWGLDTSGSIQKVLQVTTADILNSANDATASTLVASNEGYSLYKETDGSLTLVAPDSYQYNWTPSL
jgi:hypothetical protein